MVKLNGERLGRVFRKVTGRQTEQELSSEVEALEIKRAQKEKIGELREKRRTAMEGIKKAGQRGKSSNGFFTKIGKSISSVRMARERIRKVTGITPERAQRVLRGGNTNVSQVRLLTAKDFGFNKQPSRVSSASIIGTIPRLSKSKSRRILGL